MNMKNVKYLFAGLLLLPAAMYGLTDDQHYNFEASKSYENASSIDILLSPGLEEDGALPTSMLCGSDSMKDIVEREKLKAYVKSWKKSFGEYTKNTCNRTYLGKRLSTDKEREECFECRHSRWELYDEGTKQYIASVEYRPSECYISRLSVDKEYTKKGIGSELAKRAFEDMRTNHDCREIDLSCFTEDGGKFWEKLGAERVRPGNSRYIFPDPSSSGS